jgi:hypothetical protein
MRAALLGPWGRLPGSAQCHPVMPRPAGPSPVETPEAGPRWAGLGFALSLGAAARGRRGRPPYMDGISTASMTWMTPLVARMSKSLSLTSTWAVVPLVVKSVPL